MNATQLLAHFDRLAEAPGVVPRLRRFILDLAVRGKLVEQDAGDEPARKLLKRMQVERAALVKTGKIKAVKASATFIGELPPTDLPGNWSWVPFGETVNTHRGGGTPSKANSTYWHGDILWASVKDVGKSKYLDSTIDRISKAGLADSSSNLIEPGNLIVVTRMGLGKVSINRVSVAINQDLRALSLSSLMSIDYCYIFFKTHGFEGSGLTVKGIKIEELLGIAFPLPPLPEQHRIVAKVDELMTLCDQLEAAQQEREQRRDRLASASLQRLNQPAVDATPETQREHARFHLHHLPRFTSRPEHIKAMRQTIFSLAVQGRLQSQSDTDEPATAALARIGLVSNVTALPVSSTPLIPETWKRVAFEQIAVVTGGVTLGRKLNSPETMDLPYLRVANVKRGELDLTVLKEVTIGKSEFERYALKANDLLLTEGGDWDKVGRAAIWREEVVKCLHQNHIFRARLRSVELSARWFELYFNSPPGRAYFESSSKQTTNLASINMRQVRGCPVPLPPLAEQHRIVAKVDALMALCDQLETQLTITQTDNRRLLEAVLEAALAPV